MNFNEYLIIGLINDKTYKNWCFKKDHGHKWKYVDVQYFIHHDGYVLTKSVCQVCGTESIIVENPSNNYKSKIMAVKCNYANKKCHDIIIKDILE